MAANTPATAGADQTGLITDIRRTRLWTHDDAVRSFRGSAAKSMRLLMRQIGTYSRTLTGSDISVCLIAETGGGKEVVARMLHADSARRTAPFVPVNCATLGKDLAAAHLFGYNPGAFTGAAQNGAPGYVKKAHLGTLFLDEVGDLPADCQAMLLRVLETGEYYPLQAALPEQSNFRLIAATNMDLVKAVNEGRFRRDLFFRLGTPPLRIPPLRDRPEDIISIARAVVLKASDNRAKLSTDAEAVLLQYSWPGNVRELIELLERVSLLTTNDEIGADELLFMFTGVDLPASNDLNLERHEVYLIQAALRDTGGVQKDAAELLGITPRTLNYKLREHSKQGHMFPGYRRGKVVQLARDARNPKGALA